MDLFRAFPRSSGASIRRGRAALLARRARVLLSVNTETKRLLLEQASPEVAREQLLRSLPAPGPSQDDGMANLGGRSIEVHQGE